MENNYDFYIPDYEEFRKGYESYNRFERKGPVYFEALSVINHNWGNPDFIAKGIERLIRCWNRFYANFNFEELAECVKRNLPVINDFRDRNIESLSDDDWEAIKYLFNQFLAALKRKIDGRMSSVSVAKSFNLLAPNFLPLWDSKIAPKYNCFYWFSESPGKEYFGFCKKMQIMAENVRTYVPFPDDRSLLKRIDEFNYSKYTMHWA
jgi:hypothetical protein